MVTVDADILAGVCGIMAACTLLLPAGFVYSYDKGGKRAVLGRIWSSASLEMVLRGEIQNEFSKLGQ